jgi:hypothetical protein
MATFVLIQDPNYNIEDPDVFVAHGSKNDLIKGVTEKIDDPRTRERLLDAIKEHQDWNEGRHWFASCSWTMIVVDSDCAFFKT